MSRAFLTALALAAVLATAPAALGADIEGRWSLNDGEITVAPAGDGSFTGTVNKAVSGGDGYCPKPVGEVMWTEVRPQPDGQYFGRSQYYDGKGTASIVLKYKGVKVGSGRATVGPGDCRFKKTIEVKRSKAPKGQLLATASWPGNSLVRGDDGRYFANIPKPKG